MSLADVLKSNRVVVTVGSGGVGKTTTAAALSVHAAMQGKRVLCLTIDPARRLANSLGLDEMTTSEQEVPAHLFAENDLPLPAGGRLAAMMLDTKSTFDELVKTHASSPEARDRILTNRIYQYVAGSLAGTQEYMAMEKLHAVRKQSNWDLIVLDTPPTSNALDFLTAPERLIDAIDSPAVRWFMQAVEPGKGRFGMGLMASASTVLIKGLAKFTGIEFLEEVAGFVTGINDLFGGFREHATAVSEALRSPEVAFVVVTSPSPMAIREATYFSDKLAEAGMRRDAVVINGVHVLLAEPSVSDAALATELGPLLPGMNAEDTVERMLQALQDERLQAVADRIESDRLQNHIRQSREGSRVQFVEVPAFEEDVHDLKALARVASYLTGTQGAAA